MRSYTNLSRKANLLTNIAALCCVEHEAPKIHCSIPSLFHRNSIDTQSGVHLQTPGGADFECTASIDVNSFIRFKDSMLCIAVESETCDFVRPCEIVSTHETPSAYISREHLPTSMQNLIFICVDEDILSYKDKKKFIVSWVKENELTRYPHQMWNKDASNMNYLGERLCSTVEDVQYCPGISSVLWVIQLVLLRMFSIVE